MPYTPAERAQLCLNAAEVIHRIIDDILPRVKGRGMDFDQETEEPANTKINLERSIAAAEELMHATNEVRVSVAQCAPQDAKRYILAIQKLESQIVYELDVAKRWAPGRQLSSIRGALNGLRRAWGESQVYELAAIATDLSADFELLRDQGRGATRFDLKPPAPPRHENASAEDGSHKLVALIRRAGALLQDMKGCAPMLSVPDDSGCLVSYDRPLSTPGARDNWLMYVQAAGEAQGTLSVYESAIRDALDRWGERNPTAVIRDLQRTLSFGLGAGPNTTTEVEMVNRGASLLSFAGALSEALNTVPAPVVQVTSGQKRMTPAGASKVKLPGRRLPPGTREKITAVIKIEGPLQQKEIQSALRLKTRGNLGHYLRRMVAEGDLIKTGEGYTLPKAA